MDPLRVLIVDDEDELVTTLVERLKLRGLEALGVTSGEEALVHIGKETYDVILVDVKMPGMGGLKLFREVKTRLPELAVVLLSGHGAAADVEEGMGLGAFDYLLKPIDCEELIGVLRQAANKKERPSE